MFPCWGPFTDPYEPCVAGLTAGKVVDCSYSPNPTEDCYIPNGQTGEYYILLITNYSQQPCEITFSQTSGSGSTDCTILPPPVSNNGPLCVGESLQLEASFVVNATYYWSGPAGFLSTQQNPVIPNVTIANAGDYTCVITVNGQSSDPAITTVIIYDLPMATQLTGDTTICLGTSAGIQFQLVGWGPVGTVYVSPTSQTTYYFTQVRDSHCSRTLLFMSSTVSLHPQTTATISGTASICSGEPAYLTFNLNCTGQVMGSAQVTVMPSPVANAGTDQTLPYGAATILNGQASGGSGDYTYSWSSVPSGFSSTLANPVVQPDQTTTFYVAVNDGYNVTTGNIAITVNPRPLPNAGPGAAIPHGTSTQLSGSASGGSGSYAYSWEPAEWLVNPNVADPVTYNLYTTALFSLTVTDQETGCISGAPSHITVTVSGDALAVNPVADPGEICRGDSTKLFALAGGGSGLYTYARTSDPPGFTSADPDPVISPHETTIYYLEIDDGFNIASGHCVVTVLDAPVINLGPATISRCVFDAVFLDAGNPGASYLWSNGSTERQIFIASTGIGFDIQNYSVLVTDPSGCQSSASITVMFDFSFCTGIGDDIISRHVSIFPNPGAGHLHLRFGNGIKDAVIRITNLLGEVVWGPNGYDLREMNGDLIIRMGIKPDGIYIIHMLLDNQLSITHKYILNIQ